MFQRIMIVHQEKFLTLIFGDAHCALTPQDYYKSSMNDFIQEIIQKNELDSLITVERLYVLKQIHSTNGIIIDTEFNDYQPFDHTGDFLITSLKNTGLLIFTADCLPIVMHDAKKGATALIHAGWKGSLAGIVIMVLKKLHDTFFCKPEDIQVFFGPSAKPCCYEIGQEVLEALNQFSYKEKVIRKEKNSYFFDVPLFNVLALQQHGVAERNIIVGYNHCTIENSAFCSYRRDKDSNLNRQFTVVALK